MSDYTQGLEYLAGVTHARGVCYYAAEVARYVVVTDDAVELLGAMLAAGEPDAYSEWCARTAEVAS